MFDFLKKFFGESEKDTKNSSSSVQQSIQSLDIDVAIAAHENWKFRLQAYLEGHSSEHFKADTVCFDDRCDLGKWIYGPGQQLGQFPGFRALMDNHKMFHYSASNIIALEQAGKKEEAHKILDGQFSRFSSDVIEDLRILQKIVDTSSQ